MAKKSSKTLKKETTSYLDKVEAEVQTNQSKFSLVLGGLIVLVIGLLVFNYFNRDKSEVGPSQQIQNPQITDIAPENLPGKYTIKEGDTLFTIAEKYYGDGYKFTEIVKVNQLSSPDVLATGQVIEIPKLETEKIAAASITPAPIPSTETTLISSQVPTPTIPTEWGLVITSNNYTVVEGDWLSTIAARAYNGDVMAYSRIAQANNIPNPDLIAPGTVLTIPR